MTPVEFLELYQCKFEVSERDQGLYKRVEEYFKNTDNLPHKLYKLLFNAHFLYWHLKPYAIFDAGC